MKYAALLGTLGVTLLILGAQQVPALDGPPPNEKLWFADYTTARRVARQSGKPIFVVFR